MDHRHQHYLRQHNPTRISDHDGLEVPIIMTSGSTFVPGFQDKQKTATTNGNGNRTAAASNCTKQEMAAELTGNSGLLPSKMRGNGKGVRYRECLKNHAAHLGRQATDGCGEFIPSGEEGTLEALKCAACDCHRNFHRRELDGEPPSCVDCRKLKQQQQQQQPLPMAISAAPGPPPLMAAAPVSYGTRPPPQMIMAMNNGIARPELDKHEGGATDGGGRSSGYGMNMASPGSSAAAMMAQMMRKRHRTKFTNAQKELMHEFAERVGWRIQKHDEEAVQRLCAEVGVKRHVLKVWMHNNKNTYSTSTRTNPSNISNSNNNNDMNNIDEDDDDDDEDESNSRDDLPLIQPG